MSEVGWKYHTSDVRSGIKILLAENYVRSWMIDSGKKIKGFRSGTPVIYKFMSVCVMHLYVILLQWCVLCALPGQPSL